jgi:hypothetical protein
MRQINQSIPIHLSTPYWKKGPLFYLPKNSGVPAKNFSRCYCLFLPPCPAASLRDGQCFIEVLSLLPLTLGAERDQPSAKVRDQCAHILAGATGSFRAAELAIGATPGLPLERRSFREHPNNQADKQHADSGSNGIR